MRKLLIVAVIALSPAMGRAYEIAGNPDRYPSLGFNYSGTHLTGTGTFAPVPGFVFGDEKDLKDTTDAEEADFRLPLTSFLTVNFGGGYVTRSVDRVDASLYPVDGYPVVYGDTVHDKLTGPTFHVGARVYFR